MLTVTFANLWIDGAFRANVAVQIDDEGRITRMTPGPSAAEQAGTERSAAGRSAAYVPGLTLPGLGDAHCHAFQRMLAAWTQRARSADDAASAAMSARFSCTSARTARSAVTREWHGAQRRT